MTISVEVIISLSLFKGTKPIVQRSMPTRPYSKVSSWKNISTREFESQSNPIQKFTKSLISMLKNTYRNLLQVPEELKKTRDMRKTHESRIFQCYNKT